MPTKDTALSKLKIEAFIEEQIFQTEQALKTSRTSYSESAQDHDKNDVYDLTIILGFWKSARHTIIGVDRQLDIGVELTTPLTHPEPTETAVKAESSLDEAMRLRNRVNGLGSMRLTDLTSAHQLASREITVRQRDITDLHTLQKGIESLVIVPSDHIESQRIALNLTADRLAREANLAKALNTPTPRNRSVIATATPTGEPTAVQPSVSFIDAVNTAQQTPREQFMPRPVRDNPQA